MTRSHHSSLGALLKMRSPSEHAGEEHKHLPPNIGETGAANEDLQNKRKASPFITKLSHLLDRGIAGVLLDDKLVRILGSVSHG